MDSLRKTDYFTPVRLTQGGHVPVGGVVTSFITGYDEHTLIGGLR
jgi:hypothetical protein